MKRIRIKKKNKRRCEHTGCKHVAEYVCRLSLAISNRHTPAISTPIRYICADHVRGFTIDEMLTGNGWNNLCVGFLKRGKVAPVKKHSKIIVTPIPIDKKLN